MLLHFLWTLYSMFSYFPPLFACLKSCRKISVGKKHDSYYFKYLQIVFFVIINTHILRNKITVSILVPSVPSMCHSCPWLPVLCWKADREGHVLPLAAQNWLNGWTCIPQERRLLTICVRRISIVFFKLFWSKILAAQMKIHGRHSENNLFQTLCLSAPPKVLFV